MVQQETRDRIVTALIGAVAEKGWKGASLVAIAERAGISLAELRDAYESRGAMLGDFFGGIDRSVLEKRDPTMAAEVPRERLFDLLAARLDALAPHKRAIGRLAEAAVFDPLLAAELNRDGIVSMGWMLAAAGIPATGLRGALRAQALGFAWVRTLRAWMRDDDPDVARTLATLDKQLRRAERAAECVTMVKGCVPFWRRRADRDAGDAVGADLAEGHPS
jgi:AcrR family transcriptional regulator